MKSLPNYKRVFALAAALTAATMQPAMAADLGAIASDFADQLASVNLVLTIAAWIFGVVLALTGIAKWRAHSSNPNDPSNKLSSAFMLILAGALTVALPSLLGSGAETVFGDSPTYTDVDSGFNSL